MNPTAEQWTDLIALLAHAAAVPSSASFVPEGPAGPLSPAFWNVMLDSPDAVRRCAPDAEVVGWNGSTWTAGVVLTAAGTKVRLSSPHVPAPSDSVSA